MKFVLYIDNKDCRTYNYTVMNAKTLEDAIEEADKAWNENIYLARIMKKEGKNEKKDDCTIEIYKAILCRRSFGWHRNTKENSENEHSVLKYKAKYGEWFEAV